MSQSTDEPIDISEVNPDHLYRCPTHGLFIDPGKPRHMCPSCNLQSNLRQFHEYEDRIYELTNENRSLKVTILNLEQGLDDYERIRRS